MGGCVSLAQLPKVSGSPALVNRIVSYLDVMWRYVVMSTRGGLTN